jgi:hypothetical protein
VPGLGYSQYYLDPNTAGNQVVCTGKGATSIDTGTGNHVVNCTPMSFPAPLVAPRVAPQASGACHGDVAGLLKKLP